MRRSSAPHASKAIRHEAAKKGQKREFYEYDDQQAVDSNGQPEPKIYIRQCRLSVGRLRRKHHPDDQYR